MVGDLNEGHSHLFEFALSPFKSLSKFMTLHEHTPGNTLDTSRSLKFLPFFTLQEMIYCHTVCEAGA